MFIHKNKQLPGALLTTKVPPRIGIFAGAFDPVHAGHISFALQALQEANLDQVIFMPERRPRHKPGVEHYAHRIAMLKAATAPHPRLAVMEVVERHFSVSRTLPMLQAVLPEAELVFLMGSDTVLSLPSWQYAEHLVGSYGLVVGVRSQNQQQAIAEFVSNWELPQSKQMTLLSSYAPEVSSAVIRQAIRSNQPARGLLASVQRYAKREWLYVSPAYHGS